MKIPAYTLAAIAAVAAVVVVLVIATGDDESASSESAGKSFVVPASERKKADARAPNIIAITVDDMTLAQFRRRYMPQTFRRLVDRGTSFTDSIVTTPICCPSRASFITGQYGHNNGVLNNNPGYGDLRAQSNVLPSWLQRAGYRTAHVGKYLNRFNKVLGDGTVPPGWDHWYSMVTAKEYYDYELSIDGRVEPFGTDDSDYLTRVLNDGATELIRRLGQREEPYYLQLDQFAPHPGGRGGAKRDERCAQLPVPDPRDDGRYGKLPLPRPPSFNERDISDKPEFLQGEPLSRPKIAKLRRSWRCGLESLRAVDRGVARIDELLRETGQRRRTAILFSSDNGAFFGEHRLAGKLLAYEEGIEVPLIIRPPDKRFRGGGRAPARVDQPVANIDLAPTILQMAGGRPCVGAGRCRTLDGRSLVPLLRGGPGDWPADRVLGVEWATPNESGRAGRPCAYEGVRVADEVFVTYPVIDGPEGCRPSDAAELYDLSEDPFQLESLYPAPAGSANAARIRRLERLTNRVSSCAGIEGRDPRKGNRPFCD